MKYVTITAVLVLFMLVVPGLSQAESPTMCTMQYDPVCGTKDGVYKTYGNGCVLGVEGGTYQHEGECTQKELDGSSDSSEYVPPAHCTAWFDGCNRCSRTENGQVACTLMACTGAPAAGYCTAYGDTEADVDEAVETPPNDAGDTATSSSTETDSGFLMRLWNSIRSWFAAWFS